MAALTVDTDSVALVDGTSMSKLTSRASEAIVAGDVIILVPSTGKWLKADADDATGHAGPLYFALHDAAAEETLTGVKDCILDLGKSVFDGLNFGVPIYLSDTASTVRGLITATVGESADAVIVGYIVPLWSGPNADRVLKVL